MTVRSPRNEELDEDDRDRQQTEQEQAAAFREIDLQQPSVGIDSQEETVYYSTSDTSTEVLPAEEYINGI